MRDYAQHGHLLATIDNNKRYCFDLEQILSYPHFQHNSLLKKEMEKLKEDIFEYYNAHPRICLTLTLAQFNLSVTRIYMDFMNTIEKQLLKSIDEIKKILNMYPNIVYKSKDNLNGYVLYNDCDKNIHCFNPKDNPYKMYKEIKKEINKIFHDEEKELKKMKKQLLVK